MPVPPQTPMSPGPFRVREGDQLPVQASAVTCGSASLIVARMLADPAFTELVTDLSARRGAGPAWATLERAVLGHTNSAVSGAGLALPWPRCWGTPPWGARRELETRVVTTPTRYAVWPVRTAGPAARRARLHDLAARLTADRPALLYVGSRWLPRHVTLLTLGDENPSDTGLLAYDPGNGLVTRFDVDAFADGRLTLGGWPQPWFLIGPVDASPRPASR